MRSIVAGDPGCGASHRLAMTALFWPAGGRKQSCYDCPRSLQRSIAMDAVTPKGAETAETHSHLVRPDSMEWQKTRFPAARPRRSCSTARRPDDALMRFQPGAVLPDHEHVNIEQTYVLEGSLVDKEGPAKGIECKAGEFVVARTGQPPRCVVSRGGADARDLPGPQQVLRGRRPRRRCRGQDWDETWGIRPTAEFRPFPCAAETSEARFKGWRDAAGEVAHRGAPDVPSRTRGKRDAATHLPVLNHRRRDPYVIGVCRGGCRPYQERVMNYLRTAILLAGLTALFMGVGYLIGGASGATIALVVAAATNLFAYWNSDRMVLSMYGAHEVDQHTAPELVSLVCHTRRTGRAADAAGVLDGQSAAQCFRHRPQSAERGVAVTTGWCSRSAARSLAG